MKWITALVAAAALAQTPPAAPPQVLRIVREVIRPGKAAAQEKAAALAARAVGRSKYPANFLALTTVSGEREIWILESHDSFESIERADAFAEKTPAVRWWLGQLEAQDSDGLSAMRRLLATYRPDMSYRGDQFAAALPKMRYMSLVMVRLEPARDADFTEIVRMVSGAYEKMNSEQPLVVYQVVSGLSTPTYLFFSPMVTLKTMDDAPLRGKAMRDAMGEENREKMLKTSAEVTAASESFLFTLNPRLSYVSKEFADVDPDFWTPRPPKPALPPVALPGAAPPSTPAQPQ
jgi:hypothetical protein